VGTDTFTADAAGRLEGPPWLRTRRLEAAALVADAPLPGPDAEEWRYSRIAELDLSRYSLLDPAAASPSVPAEVRALVAGLGDLAAVVVWVNGRLAELECSSELTAAGVRVGQPEAEGLLGAAMSDPTDLFAAWNDAWSAQPVVIDVPAGVQVDRPVAVVSWVDAAGAAVFPRLVVRAGADASVSLVEASLSADVEALVAPVTELAVGPAARVRHTSLQDLGRRVWQLGSFVAEVDRDATLDAAVAALGGDYARLRLDCRLVGRGATGNLTSVYFGDGDQMLDLRTFQEHRAPDTTSNLLFKGAVADRSHSVYTGLIRIRPEARGTNAFQANRNLKLSEHAWAESVPNLEIENNDVRCSHASTVGPVDEDQRFYLETRGVPTAAAERLIVGGFFGEVLDDLPVPAVAPAIRARVDALLDGQVAAEASR
jgi:Fe-S cluster assembly protein SufD